MIDLRARQKYINFNIIKRIISTITAIPVAVYGIIMLILSIINKQDSIIIQSFTFVIICIVSMLINAILIIINGAYKLKIKKLIIYDFFEICNKTKIISKPKVVYVYTCHNDFVGARVLQNSNQTYKNIEIWISDGSTNNEYSKKIKQFAIKHKFNYFKVSKTGSYSKSNNLNTFLKKTKVIFDYLLITDSDEALDAHFVEHALKCFCYSKFRNLGFVSPINYFYGTSTLFSNIMLNELNFLCWANDFDKVFTTFSYSNLYSASCLISKKLLDFNNGFFPDGCLEDYFLENVALSSGFTSLIIPICPCGQKCDHTIQYSYKRLFRIFDWQIFLFKTNVFKNLNERYTTWYKNLSLIFFSVPLIILGLIVSPWIIWIFVIFANKLFTNPLFLTMLCSAIFLLITSLVANSFGISRKTIYNKYGYLSILISALYGLGSIGLLFKHWFNSTCRNKYSNFLSTPENYDQIKHKVWPIVLTFCLLGVTLTVFITLFCLFVGFSNIWPLIGFIYFLIFLLVPFIACGSFLILNSLSRKIINKSFNIENYVYPKEFYKSLKIKQKYLDDKSKKKGIYDKANSKN